MKKMKLDKNLKSSMITYGMVIVFYVVMQALVLTDNLSSLMEGLLVPLCIYSIMAVSLNLTVVLFHLLFRSDKFLRNHTKGIVYGSNSTEFRKRRPSRRKRG